MDASAIVAMIAREPEAVPFAERLGHSDAKHTSPIAIWEAVRAVVRVRGVDLIEARDLVATFLRDAGVEVMPIGATHGELALDAYAAFGKGRHAAALNMGDCFAYARAKASRASILFKGNDFARTDLTDGTLE
ncbi:type II toxin-antitoxin system VapC family toxin [Sphingomonas endophytica]|uniref:type II toxin-antitoxin system VapC family toxin n=1 Tax=Sphingomonas endophytica TaxID=869719 RepID=UPI0023AA1D11|nr:type II toxin-antitoxin system VapC family toxin [Sphingomonas endophytica]